MLICTIQKTCTPQNMEEELVITGPVAIHRFSTISVFVIYCFLMMKMFFRSKRDLNSSLM